MKANQIRYKGDGGDGVIVVALTGLATPEGTKTSHHTNLIMCLGTLGIVAPVLLAPRPIVKNIKLPS